MELISIQFMIFVAIGLLIYYKIAPKYQWVVLLALSYTFYVIVCKWYVGFIVVTTISSYFGARKMESIAQMRDQKVKEMKGVWEKQEKKKYKASMEKKRRYVMTGVLLFNFGILAWLKYLPHIPGLPRFLFPLGISFYTFQTMGYVIDVYREQAVAEKNIGKMALFVSYFPQIIQGPIGSFNELSPQFFQSHRFDYNRVKSGGLLVLWGVFKKLVVADRAVQVITLVTASQNKFSGTWVLAAALLYALQLYADFSGGIDICRGVSEMFDVEMALNFRQPYFSTSLTEYWHRWHITLGAWVRKYVFYPLSISKTFLRMGKSIKSKWTKVMSEPMAKHFSRVIPTCLASLITFLIIGIWHGANFKYIGFGLWNGLVIMLGELFAPLNAKILKVFHVDKEGKRHRIVSIFWTFLMVLIGYYFDIANNIKEAFSMMYKSVTDVHLLELFDLTPIASTGLDWKDFVVIFVGAIIIFIASLWQERNKEITYREYLMSQSLGKQWRLILTGIFVVLIFGYYGSRINPADFVYMQF